ncbi:MAG: DUF421 domain-containing protein [Clostridia bacterium]|nr:DUF421 domain-containing protein [Clostridia bacterium]
MDIIKVILTALLSIIVLFVIAKLMGHKQVAQLDFFDYISGITIGSVAAELATELEAPWKPLIALGVYGVASIFLSLLTNKFPRTRKYINGTPTILMNEGEIYRKNLKKAKLDLSEFLLLCREQGYFDLSEIQTAIFEPNGKLSVLPRAANRPITPDDMKLPVKAAHIGTEIIMDGRVMGENLTRLGRNEKWLEKQLKLQNYKSAREIFLGIYEQETDQLTLYPLS